jgi:hypothetical protein
MHALPRAWWLVALGSVAVLHATPTTAAIYVFRADRCNTNANSANVWEGGGGTMEIRNTSAMSASSISFGATTGSTVGSTVHVDVLLQGRLSAGGGLNLEVSLLPLARDSGCQSGHFIQVQVNLSSLTSQDTRKLHMRSFRPLHQR